MWDVGGYLVNCIRTLKPTWHPVANPFTLLAQLNRKQWTFFMASTICYRLGSDGVNYSIDWHDRMDL